MNAYVELIRMWYEKIMHSDWLILILIPVLDVLDILWRVFIGGRNDTEKR